MQEKMRRLESAIGSYLLLASVIDTKYFDTRLNQVGSLPFLLISRASGDPSCSELTEAFECRVAYNVAHEMIGG
jgi:hypothetical protein